MKFSTVSKVYYGDDKVQYFVDFTTNERRKIDPVKDFDQFDYDLFLRLATPEELEGNYCSSQTYAKMELHKDPIPEGVKPTVELVDEEESEYFEQMFEYVMQYYEPETTSKRKTS